jgi:hypothetical protein
MRPGVCWHTWAACRTCSCSKQRDEVRTVVAVQTIELMGPCAQSVCRAVRPGGNATGASLFVGLRGMRRALRLVLGGLLVVRCTGFDASCGPGM